MESEKVKEIKDCLDCCKDRDCETCLRLNCSPRQEEECRVILLNDALTLINELESENERLGKALVDNLEAYKDGFNEGAGLKKGVDDKLKTENQKLKDRIAKLEKENAKLNIELDKRDCIDYPLQLIKKEHLKQFAERLKERLYNFQTWGVPYYEWCKGNVVCGEIDETLKEFIGEENERTR